MLLLILLSTIQARAADPENFQMSRYFTTTVCYGKGECIGPTVKEVEKSNVTIELKPFSKAGIQGFDGWDRNSVTDEGVRFKSEIHVIRYKKPGKYKYFIYAMLRSGKREGKIKKIHLKDLSELKEVMLEDDPVKSEKGTIQAKLLFGPTLPLEKPEPTVCPPPADSP